jgi:hypothetical protein
MTTEKDFWEEEKRINAIDTGVVGFSFPADGCVALENAQPLEGTADFWEAAMFSLRNDAAFRILEAGLKPEDFGIDY